MLSVTLFLTRTPAHEFVYESTEELHMDAASKAGEPHLIGMGVNADSADSATRIKQFYMNDAQRVAFEKRSNQHKPTNAHPRPRHIQPTAQRSRKSGRWGILGMLVGPEVFTAGYGAVSVAPTTFSSAATGLMLAPSSSPRVCTSQALPFAGRTLRLVTDGEQTGRPLELFRSMERHRGDEGDGGFVAIPQSPVPYEFFAETGNSVVKKLKSEPHGRCLRVTDRSAADHRLSTKQQAVLIHPAPAIGWLIGCIGPRPLNDDNQYADSLPNPSSDCFNRIFTAVKAFGGGKVRLFVLP